MPEPITPSRDVARLIEIMAALRTPIGGCPWDLQQNFATIAPYTIEEAYEVADAIARDDMADLKDELGDLLLQVVYHARMGEEAGAFAFGDVVEAITAKMIRRHPHVFGDRDARDATAVRATWEEIKAAEREAKAASRGSDHPPATSGSREQALPPSPLRGGWREAPGAGDLLENASLTPTPGPSPQGGGEVALQPPPADPRSEGRVLRASTLEGVPIGLPALTRAVKLQDKAAKVGFDWPNLAPVFYKLKEEIAEFEEVALPADPRGESASGGRLRGADRDAATKEAAIKEEFGDILFVMANIARHLKIDPEAALRDANQKFVRRFAHIETRLAERGASPAQSNLAEMDALWDEAKASEKS